MTTVLTADKSKCWLYADHTAEVAWPVDALPSRLDTGEVRYVSDDSSPEGSIEPFPKGFALVVRIEIPGTGTTAPDYTLLNATGLGAVKRTNNERSIAFSVHSLVPNDHPYTQFSVRFPQFPDQPYKPIGGRLVVE